MGISPNLGWGRSTVLTCAAMLAFAIGARAERIRITPTTTLRAESTNNTSAANGFHGQPNGNAAAGNVSKAPLRSLLYDGATTRIWVRYMPWWGDKGHVDIGYHSDDRSQVRRQVEDMMSRGITGAIVDWYGPRQELKNRSTQYLMREAEAHGAALQFALSYDKGSLKDCRGCDATGQMIDDLGYAYKEYENSPAYLHVNGRPALFFFGLEKSPVDWARLRSSLPGRPLFIFRNSGAFRNDADDGGYAWVAPEAVKGDDPKSLEYLERFYRASRERPEKLVVGSAYKGFNDSVAGWGHHPPRVIGQDCGDTWLDTFGMANRFFSDRNQLPDLLVVTWNDYEEGTEIESGIDNCVSISAERDRNRLKWDVKGKERTLDHFTIFISRDGENLMLLRQLPPKERSFDLDDLDLESGDYVFYVKAVGRASFSNHMSQAVRVRVEERR